MKADCVSLEEENSSLKLQVQQFSVQNQQLSVQNQQLSATVALLQQQLAWLKNSSLVQNLSVLWSMISLSSPGFEVQEEPAKEEKVSVPAHEKRKAKSTPLNTITFSEDLPVEREILDLPEKAKFDPNTGEPLVCIGEEVSRKLAKKAERYFIKEIIRKKYAVAGRAEEGIKVPDLPDSLLPRCAVDESVLADIVTKKFCDHLPLYRQAEMLTREKIYISRQTLASYVSKIGDALKPLYHLLEEEIRASGNIFVDETPVAMLAPGTGKTKQGYMAVMTGGASLDPPLRVYRFLPDRKHQNFMEFFGEYRGVFHSDKYGAYENQAKEAGNTWCPCYSHIRRKYLEAGRSKFCDEVLIDIQKLFLIEGKYKESSPEERVQARLLESEPIINGLIQKNKEYLLHNTVLPKSKLNIAIGYFLRLEPYLKNYLRYPYARPDNNVAERALKLIVIGRKNWLFVGSEGGGEASAVIYSLAQTCRALKINPYHYFEDVFRRLQGHPYNRLKELLPHNWREK